MAFAALAKEELFARLAAGRAAGVTVLTPNARLGRELVREFDAHQAARGLERWESADILPFASFVERTYETALYGGGGQGLPVLLDGMQEREFWEEAIRASRWAGALLDPGQTAGRASAAWRTAHAWRIGGRLRAAAATEDARAFAAWSTAYARRTKREGLIDAARLPDLALQAPDTKLLVAYAFDILPPQALAVLRRHEFRVCAPRPRRARVLRAGFASPAEELEAAAAWTRARLEAGARRIGVVVPDLAQRRREAARVFARVLCPDRALAPASGRALPFNLSIGEPLAAWPLVAFALDFLEFAHWDVPFETASGVLRSPFLGGAERELGARALLDARLRERCGPSIALGALAARSGACPLLRAHLQAVLALRPAGGTPRQWARHFAAVLEAAGFPGERPLDSTEYQLLARWHEALAEFARLESVRRRFGAHEALGRLRRICTEALFQPESPQAPVQVLGLLEATGLEFDALWVSGLSDETWPLHPRPDPFLPLALQKRAGIPEASAESSLALDRRITAGWAAAADEVVFSWPRRVDDRDLAPSPLIAAYEEGEPEVPRVVRYRDTIFASRALETIDERSGPPLSGGGVRGGTRVLADQAACPFRAFARHRLGAQGLQAPAPVPDARLRGELAHALMAALWREIGSHAALVAADAAPAVRRAARAAVRAAGLEGRLAELETVRLERLAAGWLDLERARGAFEVVRIEDRVAMPIGGFTLGGRIDRMDRLADGTYAVIDYKTGRRASPNVWCDERPDDPQLPLYALTAAEPVRALVFARLRAGELGFAGLAAADCAMPGVKVAADWPGLVAAWRARLEALAREFASGHAPVAPKRGPNTCADCDLQPLCRVHEKFPAAFAAGPT
jgi:probable DNA repair protein